MRIADPKLRLAFLAALTAAATACQNGSVQIGDDTAQTTDDTGDTGDTNTVPNGEVPENLAEICDADSWLSFFDLPVAADYIALRRVEGYEEPWWATETVEEVGTACGNATDASTCADTLADTWPTMAGWGYCGEGCGNRGLVYTRGDEVGLAETETQLATFFGTIDTPAEAFYMLMAAEYTVDCSSALEQDGGGYIVDANYLTSDCPWTTEDRRMSVTATGEVSIIETLAVNEDGSCAGRRPEGLTQGFCVEGTEVAAHLATLARLEEAAVVAFERLADELEQFGAPQQLVRRARRAARDEIRHARIMTRLAEREGVSVPPIDVAPARERSLSELAHENAVEGCVRETFGVADALFRAGNAPTSTLRAVFGRIARDEARHAELSWDIHRWVCGQLGAVAADELHVAMHDAQQQLQAELAACERDAVQAELGAPSAPVAVAMARELGERLAA